jgi:multidrug efflux pump subunit AcrA (membrane-fusion protein)
MRPKFVVASRLARPIAILGVAAAIACLPLLTDRTRGQDQVKSGQEKSKPTGDVPTKRDLGELIQKNGQHDAATKSASKDAVAKAPSDEPAKGDSAKSDGSTAKAARGPFEVKLELKGQFDAKTRHEVVLEPKAWLMPQKVAKVVPHGSRVKKGDVLLQLDTEKLDQAIDDGKVDLALAEHALEIAEKELPILEKLNPIELEDARRAKTIADEDLEHHLQVGRALSEESARFSVKSSEERLKYSKEELRQLEKMYKDKDLTEDTEEMILQRTRFEVESGEFFLKSARINSEETLSKQIPRQTVSMRESATKAALALQKAEATLPIQLEQKRLALSKQKNDLAQTRRKSKELAADRAAFTVVAPADGILYYGREIDGNWTTAMLTGKLIVGSPITPAEVALTIVEPKPLAFRANVEEKQLYLVKEGLKGQVAPAGYPDARLAVTLSHFSAVPENGKYEARFDVGTGDDDPVLLPGMTGDVTVNIYKTETALTVPAAAVFRDDDGSRFVWLAKTGPDANKAKPEKRTVKVGRSGDGKVEILDGLGEGDEVRTSKP